MDLEQRLAAVEALAQSVQARRQLDAYLTSCMFNVLVQQGVVSANALRNGLQTVSNNLKAMDDNSDFHSVVQEHIDKLLKNIFDPIPMTFLYDADARMN